MPPILVKYKKLLSLTLANNAILFTESSITGHRVQIQMSVDDLNTFFIWQRASGTSRPIGHFLSDVSGVKFSDVILDSLNKTYNDLDGNTDGLNFSSYVFDANTDSRTRGCDGKVSSNDLVMAYILYKCYGSSTCPTANVIYNLEDAQAMLSSGAVSVSITTSFQEDEQLANLGGVNLGEVDAMFRNMLASAPLRYFQANGTQIPGLFETNYVCPPSDPPAQGSWKFMENDILELRMTFAFQQPVSHESIDSVGTQSSNTVIKAGDIFSIRLQILATDTPSGAAAKAASSSAAIAAAAAAAAAAQQQAAANAMLAAAAAQQAVNSAAAQQQADAAQLQIILTNHAEQQINVNNVAYVYGAAEASLTAAIVSGQAQSITQQTRANALAAAATLTQNQAVLANLSTQLVLTKLKYDASVSTLAGSQTVAAAALLTSANAAGVTAAAALASAQAAAAITASTISGNESSLSTLQIQMLLSNAINPNLLLSNQIAFTNASNASLSAWRSALTAQAKEQEAFSKLKNAQEIMNMAIVLGEMSNIQIMMANVNAYTSLEAKAKATLLSTNMALIGTAATEYTAYTTLLSNSNTAANLSNLLALSSYNEASRALSTTVLNVSSVMSSDTSIQGARVTAQLNLNSSIAGGGLASENTLLTSTFVGYTSLATSSSAAVTRITASSNLAQLLVNSMNSNVITTASNLSTIVFNNTALLSTFSTNMTTMINYEQGILANPSTIQSAQAINSAHITYNTMLQKKGLAQNALTVAQRILDTAVASQASPQQIALLQGNVTEAQAKLVSAEAALSTATSLYNSASLIATEDPNGATILSLAASTMTASISTALHNQLATNLYSAMSTQTSLTTVLNDASLAYTLAQAALANAITAGKGISEIQALNLAVDAAKAAYSRAAISASAASIAVSTAQTNVTADPSTMSILESAALISYSTTQGALATGLVQQVTSLYESSAVAAQSALSARLNYSTSVAALVSAVAGGSNLSSIQSLQRVVNSTSVAYATATQASIQAGAALIRGQRVADVNPLAKAILDTTSVNLAAASISESVQTYAAALVGAEAATASTLVAMGSAQTTYNVAMTALDTEIASGQSLAKIQRAQASLQEASTSLATTTVAYNNSLSTLTQTKFFFSTSTDAYTSTLSQANASPLSDSIAVVTAEVAGIFVALSTQTAALQNREVVHLASIAYETQAALVSSMAGLSTISSITHAGQSTLTGLSGLSSISSLSSLITRVQTDSLQLSLATRSVANAGSAASLAQTAASSSSLSPYIYTALANYADSVNSSQPPPSAPTGITFTSVTASGFTVRWQGFTAASSYVFVLNGNQVTPTTQVGMTATFNGLTSSTLYSVVVTSVNSKGSAPSAAFTVTTLSLPPTQPVLNVTNVTTTTAQINWSGAVGATSYSYSLNGSSIVPTVDSGLVSKFIVLTALSSQTTYSVVVTATNSLGSTASAPLTITTTGPPPTAMVLSSHDVSSSSITVRWTGGDVTTNYAYFLSNVTNPSEPFNTYGSIQDNGIYQKSVKYFGLHPSTEYMVTVIAENSGGSVNSAINVTTSPAPPDLTPTGLTATAVMSSDIVVSWTPPVFPVASYSYVLNGDPAPACTDYGLTRQTVSFYDISPSALQTVVVVAVDASGNNFPSAPFQVTTPPNSTPEFKGKWDSGTSYSVTDVVDKGGLYVCTVATNGPFSPSNWRLQPGFLGVWNSSQDYSLYDIVVDPTDNNLRICIKDISRGINKEPSNPISFSHWSVYAWKISSNPFYVYNLQSSITQDGFTLGWSGGLNTNTYSYKVTDSSANIITGYTLVDNGLSAQNIVVTGLSGGTYTVLVTASNTFGSSYDSIVVTVVGIPPGATPTSLDATSVTSTDLTLIWTGGNTATSYSYFFNGTQRTPSTNNGVSAKNAIFTGLIPSTSYTIYIVATGPYGSYTSSSFNVSTTEAPSIWEFMNVITSVGYYSFISRLDNNILIVSAKNDKLYKSIDSGATWFQINPAHNEYLNAMCMSSDGNIVYGTRSGTLRKSIDGGQTFTNTIQPGNFTGYSPLLACSANGNIVLSLNIGGLKYSTDGANTWNTVVGVNLSAYGWSVDMSSDGSIMYFADISFGVYVSRNTGVTWTKMNIPDDPNRHAFYVSCSLNGSVATVVTPYSGAFLTTDAGVTCNPITNLPSTAGVVLSIHSSTVSSDGSCMIIGTNKAAGQEIKNYVTTNSAASWQTLTIADTSTSQDFGGIVTNNLNENFMIVIGKGIYKYRFPQQATPTSLAITCTDNNGNSVVGPVALQNYPGSQFVYTFTQTGANSPSITTQFLDVSGASIVFGVTSSANLQQVIQTLGGPSTLTTVPNVITANPFIGTTVRPGFYCNSLQALNSSQTTLLIYLDYRSSVGNYYRTYDPTQYYTKVLVTVTDNSPAPGTVGVPSASFILELTVQDMS